jgi:hypothetical protein
MANLSVGEIDGSDMAAQSLICQSELAPVVIVHLHLFSPQARKDFVHICTRTFRNELFKESFVNNLVNSPLRPLIVLVNALRETSAVWCVFVSHLDTF